MHGDWQVRIVVLRGSEVDLRAESHRGKPASACNPLYGFAKYTSQVMVEDMTH